MKHPLLRLALATLLLTACTTTLDTVSVEGYLRAVDSVNDRLGRQGYTLYDRQEEDLYETFTDDDGTEYEEQTALGETYTFADSNGVEVEYTVSYEYRKDKRDIPFVHDVRIEDCYCSDSTRLELLCGPASDVATLTRLEPDQKSKVEDNLKTFLAGYGGSLLTTTALLLLIVLL